jgi:hypothetical protein
LAKVLQRITDRDQMNLTVLVCRIDTRDINIGRPDNPHNCAVARALNRRLKRKFYAVVTQTDLWIMDRQEKIERFRCSLPVDVQQFICNFDNGVRLPDPRINFYLECPKEFLQPHRNIFSIPKPEDPFKKAFIDALGEK